MLLDPLMQAISDGDAGEVERLIAQGADIISSRQTPHPRYFANTAMSPLEWAAYVSAAHDNATSRRIISGLLAGGADATESKAMLFASTVSSIEQLAQAGAPLNVTMTDGWPKENGATALMFRAEALDFDSVDLLVILGSDGSLVTAEGASALDYAIRGNNAVKVAADVDLRVQLISSIARSSPPINAFSRAMLSIARIDLLEKKVIIDPGPPPAERTEFNRFQVSVRPIMELLESYGGVPTGVVENGSMRRNLLMLMLSNRAFRYEPYDELSWLCRKYGFSLLDDADAGGESVLFHVFKPDSYYPRFMPELVKLIRLFIAHGANPNFRDNTGATVLHRIIRGACRPRGSVSPHPFPCDQRSGGDCRLFRQAMDLLISAGADPKLMDYSGKTAGREARERPNCPFTHLPVRSRGAGDGIVEAEDVSQVETDSLLSPGEGAEESESEWPTKETFELHTGERPEWKSAVDEETEELWLLHSAALVNPAAFHGETDAKEIIDALTSEDPEAVRLDVAVVSLYRNANQVYLASAGHVDPYIRINPGNGRRSSVRQAQLYEQYIFYAFYGGPGPVAKTNRPGKSKHEYGYAIDVIRANDEQRLGDALSTSGWAPTVEDEGWHWEAVDAPRYSALGAFIDNEMDALSERWALTLSSFYERRKESLILLTELEALRVDLQQAQRVAEDSRQQLAQESAWIANEDLRLRSEYDEVISLDRQIIQLQNERATKRYTYCPNEQPYATCGHPDLKQRYDDELRHLDQTILSKRVRRAQLARDYEVGRRELARRRQIYVIKQREWRAQLQQVNFLQQQVSAKRQQISTKQTQMQNARTLSATQLSAIAMKVSGWA